MYPYMSKPVEDKNIAIPENVIKEILTSSEVRMLKNRWQIIQLLYQGKTVRGIAEVVGVGTDTVVRVAKMIENKNILKSEAKKKTSTPWIFGKNND